MRAMREPNSGGLIDYEPTDTGGCSSSDSATPGWPSNTPRLPIRSTLSTYGATVLATAISVSPVMASALPEDVFPIVEPHRRLAQVPMPWPSVAAFVSALRTASAAEPREDGMSHPADALVSRLVFSSLGPKWLSEACQALHTEPAVLSELFRGLASLSRPPDDTLLALVPSGLGHPSFLVRESAVRVIEAWHIAELSAPLRKFADRERLPWLADYMRTVSTELCS